MNHGHVDAFDIRPVEVCIIQYAGVPAEPIQSVLRIIESKPRLVGVEFCLEGGYDLRVTRPVDLHLTVLQYREEVNPTVRVYNERAQLARAEIEGPQRSAEGLVLPRLQHYNGSVLRSAAVILNVVHVVCHPVERDILEALVAHLAVRALRVVPQQVDGAHRPVVTESKRVRVNIIIEVHSSLIAQIRHLEANGQDDVTERLLVAVQQSTPDEPSLRVHYKLFDLLAGLPVLLQSKPNVTATAFPTGGSQQAELLAASLSLPAGILQVGSLACVHFDHLRVLEGDLANPSCFAYCG